MFSLLARMRSLGLKSAAQKYARRLGPRLRLDYGASEHYTPGQIRSAATQCRLPLAHVAIGYAAFLPETTFNAMGLQADYTALRELFTRYVPAGSGSGADPARENVDAVVGYIGSQN